MLVITSGKKYLDIDGYASMIAYRELLRSRGIDAVSVSSAKPNYSVTRSLLDLSFKLDDYQVTDEDEFILVDLSNKDFFEEFVDIDRIVEIIDHHPGYQDYWKDILGDKATIESIGSVATIIVEKFQDMNILDCMNKEVAILLMAAILDNTLNFTAEITKKRDKDAYHVLENMTKFYNFKDNYFGECQNYIEENLKASIENDLKIESTMNNLPNVLGQLTIWDISKILTNKYFIEEVLSNYGEDWLINIISLRDNKSYVVCSNMDVLNKLKLLFSGECEDNMLVISPAVLRKEIIHADLFETI